MQCAPLLWLCHELDTAVPSSAEKWKLSCRGNITDKNLKDKVKALDVRKFHSLTAVTAN